jgi:uncharacterized membrane protein YkvA (DUF1232 family)
LINFTVITAKCRIYLPASVIRSIFIVSWVFRIIIVAMWTVILIILALAYALNPFDILPDLIVGWGWLDDIVVLGLLWRYLHAQKKKRQAAQKYYQSQGRAGDNSRANTDGEQESRSDSGYSAGGPTVTWPANTILTRSRTWVRSLKYWRKSASKISRKRMMNSKINGWANKIKHQIMCG